MGKTLEAITFDLWDTIVDDDSDEPKRAARGLRTKRAERRHLVFEALSAIEPIEEAVVHLAYDTAEAAFNTVWHDQHVTWPIATRLDVVLRGLGRTLPPAAYERVVEGHASMEVEVEPELIEGCAEALAKLSKSYKLAIVSDAIVTPGRRLRDLLEKTRGQAVFQWVCLFGRGRTIEAASGDVCFGSRATGRKH